MNQSRCSRQRSRSVCVRIASADLPPKGAAAAPAATAILIGRVKSDHLNCTAGKQRLTRLAYLPGAKCAEILIYTVAKNAVHVIDIGGRMARIARADYGIQRQFAVTVKCHLALLVISQTGAAASGKDIAQLAIITRSAQDSHGPGIYGALALWAGVNVATPPWRLWKIYRFV